MTAILNRNKQTLAFSALCMGFFIVILDVTIVNVTLPTLANYFNESLTKLQWVVAAYSLTFAGFLLLAGSLVDVFGAKRIFQIGLVAFSTTSLACGISPSIDYLIFFRLMQGCAGALLLPPSLAIINQIYQNEKQRAQAIGTWAAIGGIACASGPFLGGALTTLISWRAIFFVNIFIGLASCFLASYAIAIDNPVKKKIKIDIIGQVTSFISISTLAYALIEANIHGWNSHIILICFFVSCIACLLFFVSQMYCKNPMIPLMIFKNKNTSMALFTAMILNLCFYGSLFSMPFYFETARNYSVFMTGLALLPLPGLAVIGSYLGGKFTGRWGAGRVISIGLFLAAAGFLFLLTIENTSPTYIWLAISFLMIGLGVSFTTPAMTFAAIQSAEENRKGIIAAILNTTNQIGSLIGVAAFGTIIAASNSLVSGMHITFLISGCLFLGTSLLALILMQTN